MRKDGDFQTNKPLLSTLDLVFIIISQQAILRNYIAIEQIEESNLDIKTRKDHTHILSTGNLINNDDRYYRYNKSDLFQIIYSITVITFDLTKLPLEISFFARNVTSYDPCLAY